MVDARAVVAVNSPLGKRFTEQTQSGEIRALPAHSPTDRFLPLTSSSFSSHDCFPSSRGTNGPGHPGFDS
ncbi:unnamed protein product [Lampetra fluviatilis]